MPSQSRRHFLALASASTAVAALKPAELMSQLFGERPARAAGLRVLNPRCRVPVGWIIDDSTCLVNLNRFAMPQFDEAHQGRNPAYHKPWRDWPVEIPDDFVRKFADWCAEHGVKGKYSIVPFPACVGRVDRELPGWSRKELAASVELVRSRIVPNWDIHPEMVTHTRVIDTRIGHPFADYDLAHMENWEWTNGKSVDELSTYLSYALRILRQAGLPCEGITTPGGFGNRVLPELAQASLLSVRDVFSAEIPHYFRHLYDQGSRSVAPRVEYASGLATADPKCVVSIIGCTGDWTGGWDCTEPEGADPFITPDLQRGRMVEVIDRNEPAFMVCHWTGIYWNGHELGFRVLQEVVKRLHARYDHLLWMKTSELARYWAARELTSITSDNNRVRFSAPFSCPDFTLRCPAEPGQLPRLSSGGALREVSSSKQLRAGTWCREDKALVVCFDLPKGVSTLTVD